MGLQQYKVFNAMQEQQEFTAHDLAEATGVNIQSIYSILRRNPDKVVQIESIDTGCRGGKIKKYKIKPEFAQEIREQLNMIFNEIPVVSILPSDSEQPVDVPVGLEYAEDIYLRRIPHAEEANDVNEFRRLHKLANRSLQTASHEFEEIKGTQLNDQPALDEIESRFHNIESLNRSYERKLNYLSMIEPLDETSSEAIEEIEEEAVEEIEYLMRQVHADLSHLELANWEEPFEREKISNIFPNKVFKTFMAIDANFMIMSKIFDIFSEDSILYNAVKRLRRRFDQVNRNLEIVGLGQDSHIHTTVWRELDTAEQEGKILINGQSANYL
jgi:hypothetical protein